MIQLNRKLVVAILLTSYVLPLLARPIPKFTMDQNSLSVGALQIMNDDADTDPPAFSSSIDDPEADSVAVQKSDDDADTDTPAFSSSVDEDDNNPEADAVAVQKSDDDADTDTPAFSSSVDEDDNNPEADSVAEDEKTVASDVGAQKTVASDVGAQKTVASDVGAQKTVASDVGAEKIAASDVGAQIKNVTSDVLAEKSETSNVTRVEKETKISSYNAHSTQVVNMVDTVIENYLDANVSSSKLALFARNFPEISEKMGIKSDTSDSLSLAGENSGKTIGKQAGIYVGKKVATILVSESAEFLGLETIAAATAGPTFGASEIFAAVIVAFEVTLAFLDALGPYSDVKTKDMYTQMRSGVDKSFADSLKKANLTEVLVMGPLDKLPDLKPKFKKRVKALLQGSANPSKGDVLSASAQAYKELCTANKGVLKGASGCSYATEDGCNNSFTWPPKLGEYYSEWNTKSEQCEATSPAMKMVCSTSKLLYKPGIGNSCDLTFEYCNSKGMKVSNGDCYIDKGQEIMEQIFSKTLVRGLKQLFDGDQYSKCGEGEYDDGYFCRRTDCPPGTVINSARSFCYEPCKSGWHSVDLGASCSQDCPAPLTDSGSASCLKPVEKGRGVGFEPSCPKGSSKSSPGFCQPQCDNPDYPFQVGLICYHKDVDKGLLVKIPVKGSCDSGQRDDGTSCWEDWHCWGTFPFDLHCGGCGCIKKTLFDRQSCPSGYSLKAGMCYANSITVGAAKSVGEVGECPEGNERQGLLCYPKCDAGWTPSGLNLCAYNCPDGLAEGGVANCIKKPIQVQHPTVPGIKITAKHRVIDFASNT